MMFPVLSPFGAISVVGATAAAMQHKFEHVAIAPASRSPAHEVLDAEPYAQDDEHPGRSFHHMQQCP